MAKKNTFFKLNKTIIEVIEEKDKNKTPEDKLWGLAWEVEDIVKKKRRIVSIWHRYI